MEQEQSHDDAEDFFAQAAQNNAPDDLLEDVDGHGQQYFGGDLHGTTEEASEARFAEGLPLLPHDQDELAPQASTADPFADDGGGDDDGFFSQVRGDEPLEQLSAPESMIQRRSTQDVLGGMGVESPYAAPKSLGGKEGRRPQRILLLERHPL